MSVFYFLLAVLLVVVCFIAVLSGRLFVGGKTVYRDEDPKMFYVGLVAYLAIALFSVLFGKEL